MSCPICDHELPNHILFENDKMMILLAPAPATVGHLQIYPKTHYPILEAVPDEELAYLSIAANKISMLLFESMKAHGTNIIIQNGNPAGQRIAHVALDIIPRRTDDGLKLDWDLKQAAPESLDSIKRIIEEGMTVPAEKKPIILNTKEPEKPKEKKELTTPQPSPLNPHPSTHHEHKHERSSNNFIRSLERIP